jgi:pyruvate dehydrogenase (quinone)
LLAGDPKLEASQELPDFPFAGHARSLGLDSVPVDDPNVPPLPPHLRMEQARRWAWP